MSRYQTMTAAEILATMGGAMRDGLEQLPNAWTSLNASTRDALLTRGLAVEGSGTDLSRWLHPTERGLEVLDLVHADDAADTWETTR